MQSCLSHPAIIAQGPWYRLLLEHADTVACGCGGLCVTVHALGPSLTVKCKSSVKTSEGWKFNFSVPLGARVHCFCTTFLGFNIGPFG